MKFTGFISSFSFLLIIWILFPISTIISQNNTEPIGAKSLLDSTKKKYGSSELLVNGPLYFQTNRSAKGTPYLINEIFIDGDIYTAGETFPKSKINYDISTQELLLLILTSNAQRLIISLSEVLVDSFNMDNELYVRSSLFTEDNNFSYLHSINNGTYRLIAGYAKEFVNRYNANTPNGKYSGIKKTYYIQHDNELIEINTKKDFLNLFGNHQKEISNFLRKNKIKLGKSTPEELRHLMDFCNKKYSFSDD